MSAPKNTVERIHPRYFYTKEKYLLYLRHVFAYEEARRRLPPAARVLEIGCGDGYGAALLAGRAAHVTAVDVDPEAVAHAEEAYGEAEADFRTYDGVRLPFGDGAFDVVAAFQVIEHVEDDRGFVAEARRVLKPGGLFLCTTPNRATRVPPGEPLWNPFHVREYRAAGLAALLAGVFETARVLGIRGDDEAQRIELARVRRGLSLRKLLPEFVRGWIDGDVRSRYGTDRFRVEEEGVEESLDLMGVGLK